MNRRVRQRLERRGGRIFIVMLRKKRKLEAEATPKRVVAVPSKRAKAFELFSQGKTPDDPEVVALGLKAESAKKYFRLWKQK